MARVEAPRPLAKAEWPPNYTQVFAWRQQTILQMRHDPDFLRGAKHHYRENPIDFICHWCDTFDPRVAANSDTPAHMPFVMFERQAEFVMFLMSLLDDSESGLVEKCRDVGATWLCAAFSAWLWLYRPGSSVGWGSRKESYVDKIGDPDSIFQKIRIILGRLPAEFLPKNFSLKDHAPFMRIINPENGSTITGEAGDSIGRGGRKLIYFKDESAHYERPEGIEASLGDNTNIQVDISSVNGLGNVFHRKRQAGSVWTPDSPRPPRGTTRVFVFDWREHPAKDQAWYDSRRRSMSEQGLLHIFEQEVNRNYSASVTGVVIPAAWVDAMIDADKKLGLDFTEGARVAGLDVADGGRDTNAVVSRKGRRIDLARQWGEENDDPGMTTRMAIQFLSPLGSTEVQYDSIGVGAAVKSEANRLEAEEKLPKSLTFVPWAASASPLNKEDHLLLDENGDEDEESPLIGDFFQNLKAQGWWELRACAEKTYRAVVKGDRFPVDEMLCISGDIENLAQLREELSQVTWDRTTGTLKLKVNKTPEGTKSPNLGDAAMMCCWPSTVNYVPVGVFLRTRAA